MIVTKRIAQLGAILAVGAMLYAIMWVVFAVTPR